MNYLKFLKNNLEQERTDDKTMSPLEYLSNYVFDFTTYDSEKDELFALKALEVCFAITINQTFQYQEDEGNYTWYLLMCNMPFFENKLEWGGSIRGAWWDLYGNNKFELSSCGFYEGDKQILTPLEFDEKQWSLFIGSMMDFVKEEQLKKETNQCQQTQQ